MSDAEPRIEYVEARRVLLDALDAMRPHLGAIVLVGAQAVYLRTKDRSSLRSPAGQPRKGDRTQDRRT